MKQIKITTSKGTWVVSEIPNKIKELYEWWDLLPEVSLDNFRKRIQLSKITEDQASEIVDSLISETLLGKLFTGLENNRIEIYQHEGKSIKFIRAVNCLHSLLKSKGIHLYENTYEGYNDILLSDEDNKKINDFKKGLLEEKTFYNPYIFKL